MVCDCTSIGASVFIMSVDRHAAFETVKGTNMAQPSFPYLGNHLIRLRNLIIFESTHDSQRTDS